MKAKIITYSICTRIIVDDSATEDDIIKASSEKVQKAIIDERHSYLHGDNVVEIEDDIEVPFNSEFDEVEEE